MPCVAVWAVSQLAMLWGSVFEGDGGGGVQVAAQGDEGPVPVSKALQAGWSAIHLPLKKGWYKT